jgi:hypothetical protein
MRLKAVVKTKSTCTSTNRKLVAHRVVVNVVGISPCNGVDIACKGGRVVVMGRCPDAESARRFRAEVEDAVASESDLSGRKHKKRR